MDITAIIITENPSTISCSGNSGSIKNDTLGGETQEKNDKEDSRISCLGLLDSTSIATVTTAVTTGLIEAVTAKVVIQPPAPSRRGPAATVGVVPRPETVSSSPRTTTATRQEKRSNSDSGSIANKAISATPSSLSEERCLSSTPSLQENNEASPSTGENAVTNPIIKLPDNLEGLNRAEHFPNQRHRWNTNEEIASILISFTRHPEWLSKEVKIRPRSGSMLLYSRKKVRYRRDGYCWKKRKDGKTTREDHMKLKVQGTECIYGCYVHSAILPTFHRRCYWLLQNPDIVLVHYLNVPYPDDNKLIVTTNVSMWGDKKEWTKEELISQLKPMFFSEEEPDLNNELELSTAETVEAIVLQLMEKQRLARQNVSVTTDTLVPVTVTAANPNSNPCNPGIVNVSLNGGGSNGATGCGGIPTGRLSSSSSSSSSMQQMPNLPSNGSPVIAASGSNSVCPSVGPFSAPVGGNCDSESIQQHAQHNRVAATVNLTAGTGGPTPERNFVLNLSQFQTAGGLIILNGKPASTAAAASVTCQSNLASSQGASVRHHSNHTPALTTVQNISTNATPVSSSLAASLMDIQNANIHPSEASSGPSTTISNSNQTLFVHHSQQHQQHFTTTLTSKVAPSQSHPNHPMHHQQPQHPQQQPQHQAPPQTLQQPPQQQQIPQHIVHHGGGPGHKQATPVQSHVNGHPPSGPPQIKYEPQQQQHPTTQQQQHHQQQHVPRQAHQHHHHHHHHHQQHFYQQETLDMSHEDIQQTLSANMGTVDTSGELEPMSPSADDVFVNLDAFDILADLSEDLDQHHDGGLMGVGDKNTIVDINPEWAYSEGGTKILIIMSVPEAPGQFSNPHQDYSVHFGDLPVPAVYLQVGVLKCFCPPHSPGLVPIRVYSNGKQISSNSMVFEYKADLRLNMVPVPPTDTSLKLCLIHRMECLEKCFRNFKGDFTGIKSLEDGAVRICMDMMNQEWLSGDSDLSKMIQLPDRGMTLLHLSAALGYARLVFTLIRWKRENPSKILDSEVDPLQPDEFGLLPLMWCARYGHLECGIILAQWSPDSLQKRDNEGLNPVQIAVARGFVKCASELEKIQTSRATPGFGQNLDSEDFTFTNVSRFQGSSGSVSDDFGLKDAFFGQPDTTLELAIPSEEESRVLTLAEQIIAAMPERIKKESYEDMSPSESQDSSSIISSDPSEQNDFAFEFSDRNYRYYESGTPCSSLSPSSSSCLQSPCSSSFTVDSPQPTTADFCEFLQASAFEKDFSNLTLSDREQRELYEAAKVIQKAYRSYKGRKKLEEEEKEKAAAVIIQNYYRRYKQYAYLRQVTQAALVIQNQYRNYCENKRFKKSSQETESEYLLATKESTLPNSSPNPESSSSQPTQQQHCSMRSYSQRKQHQAAKKIQQFMKQSKTNFWESPDINKTTERTGRKREATMPTSCLEVHCPAPAKIAMSSSPRHHHHHHHHHSGHLPSTFFSQSIHRETEFIGADY